MSSKRDSSGSQGTIKVLDVVALLVNLHEHGLARGQVGTIVETLSPESFEVEFNDDQGRTYAQLALQRDQLMALHHHPMEAA